jgi:hypothetical protein
MAAGRPSKYQPAYCNEAVEFLAQGYSVMAFAGEIGVSRDTIYEWCEVHPEFSDSIKIGKAKGARWWEDRIRSGELAGPQITAAIFALKNRAGDEWREKQEHEHTGKDGAALIPIININGKSGAA